jgi:hypothetical protein
LRSPVTSIAADMSFPRVFSGRGNLPQVAKGLFSDVFERPATCQVAGDQL